MDLYSLVQLVALGVAVVLCGGGACFRGDRRAGLRTGGPGVGAFALALLAAFVSKSPTDGLAGALASSRSISVRDAGDRRQMAAPSARRSPAMSALGRSVLLRRIAACESGGDPTAASATGRFRGKYQFDTTTWASMGGTGDPALAGETEQDRRASLLLRARGTQPWPVCGRAGSFSPGKTRLRRPASRRLRRRPADAVASAGAAAQRETAR